MLLLCLYVGSALSISFVCSVLEATLLASRTVELLERKGRGDRGAALLLELKQDRVDEAIGAILTLNTIAHTVGAALAGARAATVFGDAWLGVFSGVLTLLVLIASEIVPKTLGTSYSSQLTTPTAFTIDFLTKILRPLLIAIRLATRWFVPAGQRSQISRAEVAALAASAAKEGILSEEESRTVSSLLRLRDVRVSEVMVPRTVVAMLPESTTIEEFLEDRQARVYARIPLFSSRQDDASVYVLQRDVLAAAASGVSREMPLGSFARPVIMLPETVTVERALQRLIGERDHLALVFDEFGSLVGIVTLEDLVEAALGVAIADETDVFDDLRAEARRRFVNTHNSWCPEGQASERNEKSSEE